MSTTGAADERERLTTPGGLAALSMALVIVAGLIRGHPAVALQHSVPSTTEAVRLLLILRAFASGCPALTEVEAIANSVPQFRQPRARRAQHTEMWLGLLLGGMLLGLGTLIRRWDVVSRGNTQALIPVFAVGVFVGFTLSQVGMVRHWRTERGRGYATRAIINGFGAARGAAGHAALGAPFAGQADRVVPAEGRGGRSAAAPRTWCFAGCGTGWIRSPLIKRLPGNNRPTPDGYRWQDIRYELLHGDQVVTR